MTIKLICTSLLFNLKNYFYKFNCFHLVLPNTTTEQVEKFSILEGGNIAISCCSIGGPVPLITWTLNNHNTEYNQTSFINKASLSFDLVTIGNINSTLIRGPISYTRWSIHMYWKEYCTRIEDIV